MPTSARSGVSGNIQLKKTARLKGDVRATKLHVEEGATFNGECQMGQTGQIRKKAGIGIKETVLPKRPTAPQDDQLDVKDTNKARTGPQEQLSPKF